jgi:catechol 2,3-dioxygenase-like lactoylglutathione lyase family enzyme
MLDHVSIGVRDVARAARFYDAVLAKLGYACLSAGETSLGYGVDGHVSFWIGHASAPVPADKASGLHFCLAAPDRAAVDAFHAAALVHGGACNGAPGLRAGYGDNYYAAFVVDPEGYRIEAFCGLPEGRSARPPGYLRSSEALADLSALNARFIHNYVTNDVASHDALLHAAFLYIRSNGERVDRATYLKNWATGFDPEVIVYWDLRDELISVVGDVALVRAVNRHVVRRDGEDEVGMSAYTDVYLLEDGAWRCIQAQITEVAPGCEPSDATILRVYRHGVLEGRAT